MQLTAGSNMRATTNTFDPLTNRLKSVTNSGGSKYNYTYQYDARGNLAARGSQIFTFDMGNRLTKASGKATYAYDGLGHRFSTVGTDGVNRLQIYSQEGQLLYTTTTTQGTKAGTKYIYLHNHLIAEVKR